MEHESQDLNVIRGSEDEGDVHDSATLLGQAPTMNNDNVSEAYSASMSPRRNFDHLSEDDFRSPTKHKNRSKLKIFIGPIIACSWQSIVLVIMIVFIKWTESTAYPIVPRLLENLYQQYPQGTATAITLVGSLLSLLSTKAFSEAIRFATVVSLASPGSKNISLYSLYARITVGSGNALFDFGKGRRVWTIMSLVSLFLFTVQTAAWTTLLTPRATDIPYQTSFQDLNYTETDLELHFETLWATAFNSGYAAVTEGTNLTEYISFNGYLFNGTSRGISPIVPTFDNWTRIEAIQQGATAEVLCTAAPASDPYARLNRTNVAHGITEISFCCNCTAAGVARVGVADLILPLLAYNIEGLLEMYYLLFSICPISKADNVITAYITDGTHVISTQICTIRPQWLNVNVTYIRDGFVTLEPTGPQLPDIPLFSSSIIQAIINTLQVHFTNSQTAIQNNIASTIFALSSEPEMLPDNRTVSQFHNFLSNKMAEYIRGVFEYAATYTRAFGCYNDPCPEAQRLFSSTTYVHAIVWGQLPRYRLIIAISPLAIMIASISIIFASLYRARRLDLDYIASFNAMDTLHVIAACSRGNVYTVLFPDNSKDIGLFSRGVDVELTEGKAGSGAACFHFSRASSSVGPVDG